ncbi:hypothetical protein BDP27DRAFT_1417942 [Rhodocollybia butyracea]|uniref:Uncharacterized protein n=1 Tax=Rhodocollybia butyracea TaxID=206335 RepID=A0A9P5PUE5_9AGAR|nr:hypothetical protein BDP27DRAFT_1417942 [Rhodocollybia butyracea]
MPSYLVTSSENGCAKTHRAERGEQRDRIQELIFEAKRIDVAAIEAYLIDLLSSLDATTTLDAPRSRISKSSSQFKPKDMRSLVSSLFSGNLLSPEKAELDNEVFLTDVGGVLNMQLAKIDE